MTSRCGSADTASAAPPPPSPPACRSGSVRWLTASLPGSGGMRSSSPPRHPLLQNEGASCDWLSPEEEECLPPPPADRQEKSHSDVTHWLPCFYRPPLRRRAEMKAVQLVAICKPTTRCHYILHSGPLMILRRLSVSVCLTSVHRQPGACTVII